MCIGIAIFYLYSGVERDKEDKTEDGPALLDAVPSDASLVAYGTVSGLKLFQQEELDVLKRHKVSVSLHYSGKFHALYAVDVRRVDTQRLDAACRYLLTEGYFTLREGDILLVSKSQNLLKSASRHVYEKVSVKDAQGFMDAFESVGGQNVLVVCGAHARRLLSASFSSTVASHSTFVSKVADWYALRIDDEMPLGFEGSMIYDGHPDEFLTCLQHCNPGVSEVAECLPAYTMSVISVPVDNHADLRKDYPTFADSRGKLNSMLVKQAALKKKYGISPAELFDRLVVKELATATMLIGDKLEKINLIRIENRNPQLIFADPQIKTMRGYLPAVHQWMYPSYVSSVYGSLFELKDESCFTYIDGWLVIGSRAAINEYVTRNALHYTLKEYAAHAGRKDLLSEKPALVVAYFSLTAQKERLGDYISKAFQNDLIRYVGQPQYCPAVLYVSKEDERMTLSAGLHALNLSRTKAPSHDRDITVVVPEGPFKVLNSHTGKTNTFYQNKQKSLCLRDENGKDLWGVPFDRPVCGTAHNVDVYQNGKLQIVFGAGSKLYVIDRLGRYVNGYPLDLQKEILIGPDVYENKGKTELMVLHKDNTLEMYTLQGRKASSWKTISVNEQTIKGLPTPLNIGDSRYWIVRTSIQTLIYPYEGGKPVLEYEGDKMIMPDSEVTLTQNMELQVTCYDGKTRTVRLK